MNYENKSSIDAANANYWVGRGGTINKGCSVRVGGEGRALQLGLGAARATSPSPGKPWLPEATWKASTLVSGANFTPARCNSTQAAFIEHLRGTDQYVFHMVSTYYCL